MSDRVEAPADPAAHVPIRTCTGCRRRAPRATLVRLAVRDGRVVVDPDRRCPGRGAWLCRDADCLEQALRKGAGPLRRALRAPGATVDVDALAARVVPGKDAGRDDGEDDWQGKTRDAARVEQGKHDDSVVRETQARRHDRQGVST